MKAEGGEYGTRMTQVQEGLGMNGTYFVEPRHDRRPPSLIQRSLTFPFPLPSNQSFDTSSQPHAEAEAGRQDAPRQTLPASYRASMPVSLLFALPLGL